MLSLLVRKLYAHDYTKENDMHTLLLISLIARELNALNKIGEMLHACVPELNRQRIEKYRA